MEVAMMRERKAFGKKRSNKIGSSASNKQSTTDAGSKRGGSIVVIIDGSVAFTGESKPAAWAFVAAAGRGEIYRLCKSHWPIE